MTDIIESQIVKIIRDLDKTKSPSLLEKEAKLKLNVVKYKTQYHIERRRNSLSHHQNKEGLLFDKVIESIKELIEHKKYTKLLQFESNYETKKYEKSVIKEIKQNEEAIEAYYQNEEKKLKQRILQSKQSILQIDNKRRKLNDIQAEDDDSDE